MRRRTACTRSAPSWRRWSGSGVRRHRPQGKARTGDQPARARVLFAAILGCLAVGACAVVEAPPGGAIDEVPPRLAAASPDSGSLAVGALRTFRLAFSEKMTRQPADGWLHFYPPQRIRSTSWHGAREAEVELFEPLPADTVVVIEIAGSLQDAHKVKSRESRRFPVATGDSLPTGRLGGALVMGDSAVANGVVELFAIPPDTVEYFQQPLLRRTTTDRHGRWILDWLPVPGGPWLVRAFSDGDGNLRPGDREAQRLLPDTLSLADGRASVNAGALTLYAHGTPGRLRVDAFATTAWSGLWCAWPQAVSESDTGWTPAPQPRGRGKPHARRLDPTAGTVLDSVASGRVRVVLFADVDNDSLLSTVSGEMVRALALASGWPDSLPAAHYLEPWWLVEGLQVPPGLAAPLAVPATTPTLTAWTQPDSLTADAPPPGGGETTKEQP